MATAKLARPLEAQSPSAGASIPFPARNDHSAYLAHVVPIRAKGRDLFLGGRFILVLTLPLALGTPSVDLLEGRSGSSGRTCPCCALAGGKPVAPIAADHGVAVGAVRSRIERISSKTGARHQAECVRLDSGLSFSP